VAGRIGGPLLALGATLATLLLAESALDVVGRPRAGAGFEKPEPFYPWSLNTSGGEPVSRWGDLELAMHPFALYFNLPDQRARFYSTDARGLRRNGGERPAHPAVRVVVVGGSAAFGTGLPADADTFPARLEALLDGSDVRNAAVIGHLSGQELTYLVTELVDLRPDLVIALDGWNDLVDQSSGPRRTLHTAGVSNSFFLIEDRMRLLYRLESGAWPSRAAHALPLVFKNLARLVRSARGELAPADADAPPAPEGEIGRSPASLAAVYAGNVAKMRTVAEAFGARFLCVLQPDREALRAGAPPKAALRYARFRAEARRRLRDAGVAHLDLNDFRGALAPGMFMDRVHLDPRGNRAAAELVRDAIRSQGLLEQGRRSRPRSEP
jgi:lysophospholipase L1-like esterase